MHGKLSCEVSFFVYCVMKRVVDHASTLLLIQECACACGYSESEKGDHFMLAIFSGVRRKFSWRGFHSVAYGGHLYLVCTFCDVTI